MRSRSTATSWVVPPAAVSGRRVKLLEPGNHLLLMLVQPGVVDRHGDLVGEGAEETLVLGPVAFLLVRHPYHADHFPAQPERHAEKGPDGGMAGWLAHPRRVMLDIVGDIRAVFCDRDPGRCWGGRAYV